MQTPGLITIRRGNRSRTPDPLFEFGQALGGSGVNESVEVATKRDPRRAGVWFTLSMMIVAILAGSPIGGRGSSRRPRTMLAGLSFVCLHRLGELQDAVAEQGGAPPGSTIVTPMLNGATSLGRRLHKPSMPHLLAWYLWKWTLNWLF
jgi:hypothetical protein